jgi:hypothetical protein
MYAKPVQLMQRQRRIFQCHPFIVDDHARCEKWASEEQCTSNSAYMLLHCEKTCDGCDDEVVI